MEESGFDNDDDDDGNDDDGDDDDRPDLGKVNFIPMRHKALCHLPASVNNLVNTSAMLSADGM